MTPRSWPGRRDERGVYAILYALLTLTMLAVAAIVVDLALMREGRATTRSASDSAVVAAASSLNPLDPSKTDPRKACQSAWKYLLVGVDDHSDFPTEVVAGLPRVGPEHRLRLLHHVVPHEAGAAAARLQDRGQYSQRRRLAGAVRAQQPEDAPRLHGEGGVVEGDDVTEALRDGIDDEGHARVAAFGRFAGVPAAKGYPMPTRSSG